MESKENAREVLRQASIRRLLELNPQWKEDKFSDMSNSDLINAVNDTLNPSKLHMHESYWSKEANMNILRVPSGWIYSSWDNACDEPYDSVFVPKILTNE